MDQIVISASNLKKPFWERKSSGTVPFPWSGAAFTVSWGATEQEKQLCLNCCWGC